MLQVSQLFIYPIKSLGGIAISSAMVLERGFAYDRRWMLIDENNCFISQRENATLALLQVELTTEGLKVYHKKNPDIQLPIPFISDNEEKINVTIWEDSCKAKLVSTIADEWFSKTLSIKCRLVYMPDDTIRYVNKNYAFNKEITSFSDDFPFLIIGQSSLADLNEKLEERLPVNRFRPNIVFTGGEPFEEDLMEHFVINSINFFAAKPCARCVITTINQDNAEKEKEPLQTLSGYRAKNNKVLFGQNLIHTGKGVISVGDSIKIIKKRSLQNSNSLQMK